MTSNNPAPVTILAETQIVNHHGDLETFDSFTDRSINSVDGYSVTKNKSIESTYLTDFDGVLDTETGEVIELTFTSGEKFECLSGSQVLTNDYEWVDVDNLEEGNTLRTVIYNSSHRYSQQTLKQIAAIERTERSLITAVGFVIRVHDNILVSVESDSSIMLLPFKPVA